MPSVAVMGEPAANEAFLPVSAAPNSPASLRLLETRVDGDGKVRGATRFVTDLRPERVLHVAYATSPIPHGSVRVVDTNRAAAVPGVIAIVSGRQSSPIRIGRRLQDWPLLAWDRVRFVGERVAAVAA